MYLFKAKQELKIPPSVYMNYELNTEPIFTINSFM